MNARIVGGKMRFLRSLARSFAGAKKNAILENVAEKTSARGRPLEKRRRQTSNQGGGDINRVLVRAGTKRRHEAVHSIKCTRVYICVCTRVTLILRVQFLHKSASA